MDDTRAGLIVFLFWTPQILESAERRQNWTTNPHGVLPLRGRDNLDLHTRRRERRQFLLHAVRNTREHGCATGQHDVAVEIATDIEVALENGVVSMQRDCGQDSLILRMNRNSRRLVNTSSLKTEEGGLEERLRSAEPRSDLIKFTGTSFLGETYRSLPIVITCPSGSS